MHHPPASNSLIHGLPSFKIVYSYACSGSGPVWMDRYGSARLLYVASAVKGELVGRVASNNTVGLRSGGGFAVDWRNE